MPFLQSFLSLAAAGMMMASSSLMVAAPQQDANGLLFLANRHWTVSAHYAPEVVDSGVRGQVRFMRKDAADALKEMFDACRAETGVTLLSVSGYRSYQKQANIYRRKLRSVKGNEAKAQEYVAPPGASEHQLGLAMDIGQLNKSSLNQAFGKTKGGQWARENSWRFGFILRYDEPWEAVTGYKFEPWHFRFVGRENALRIHEANIPLETWLQEYRVQVLLELLAGP